MVGSDQPVEHSSRPTFGACRPVGPANGRYWSGHKESRSAFMFWLGSDTDKREPLTPSIEINFSKSFDRARKGRLLEDGDGGIWIGHRGCLGGGRASVPMAEFDHHIRGFTREAVLLDASKGKREEIYVLGSLASDSFLPRLQRYLEEAERIREIKRSEKR